MGRTHPNLVGHWRAENNPNDTSGNNRHASYVGAEKYAKGRVGAAYDFNPGSSDYVSINLSGLDLTQPSTLNAWVRYEGFDPSTGGATHDYSIGGRTAAGDRIYLATFRSNSTNYSLGLGNIIDTNVARVGVNVWQHVALAWGGGTYNFYLNGVSRFSGSYSGLTATPHSLGVGGLLGEGGLPQDGGDERFFMDGQIDDVQIWNRALQPHHIRAIYNGVDPAFIGDVA
jgi:hypothetical protein